jgi:small subunit ribosomal protein S7
MPRGGKRYEKHPIQPDPKYQDALVSKFINKIQLKGKKSLARKQIYLAIEEAGKIANKEGLDIFREAIKNVMPILELKSRRVGGANYQVPVEVGKERRINLAIQWIRASARARRQSIKGPFWKALALELIDASKNQGAAIKKREDTHRMAEANRAFAHFARF